MKPEALIDAFDQAGTVSHDAIKLLTVQWAAWLAGNWDRISPADQSMVVAIGGVLFDKGANEGPGFSPSVKSNANTPRGRTT